ncbi:ATP-grasp domain-containing protein [Paenibacillus hexagrammi]|uniref:Uncharacterized protein n=1 Tax=Paenibacillus hexagrammi TaxID=2908839 RepID=A0ABY3SJJ5_9BACL|nr:hypothetical protein [Paenibacillus sp. YPD9-1]UJF34222.1 hypothetical protein L0M14_03040 [Paenibacillus sp. YPD9-1]
MIVIVNPMGDPHGQYMAEKLRSMRIDHMVLGSPEVNDYALREGALYYNGQRLEPVSGVYYRSITNMKPTVVQDARNPYNEHSRYMSCMEAVHAWLSILDEQGSMVMNPPGNHSKYVQLYALQRLGIRMPKTLVTSSPSLARTFVQEVGQAVCKPLGEEASASV